MPAYCASPHFEPNSTQKRLQANTANTGVPAIRALCWISKLACNYRVTALRNTKQHPEQCAFIGSLLAQNREKIDRHAHSSKY